MGGPATLLGRLGKPRGVDAGVGNRKKQIRTVTGPLHSPGPGGGALSWNISHHHKEHGSAQRSVDFQPNLAFRCPKHAPCLSLLVQLPQTAACLSKLWAATSSMGNLAALEKDLLEALKKDGARLLEQALNDPDLPLANNQRLPGEEDFGLRSKGVLCLLGPLHLRRHYFYDARRGEGRFPLDQALGLVDGYSPEVTRWMCRAAAMAGSYEAASQDLLTYEGLNVDGRQIQRMVEQIGPLMDDWHQAQPAVFDPTLGEVFCVTTDGTGAPMLKKALTGRKGKNGRARTREVKVGAVFTHRAAPPDKKPLRDHHSTSYLAEITSAQDFGGLLRAEALRRGLAKAKVVVFLGDGAAWIWGVARINFPQAICILDYYHAAEHLALLANALYGEGTPESKKHFRKWRKGPL